MKKMIIFSLLMAVWLIAHPASAQFSPLPAPMPDFNSESWQRVQLEEWISYQVTDAARRMVPEESFHVVTRLEMNTSPTKAEYYGPRSINIDKFGLSLALPGAGPRRAGLPKDFFKRIATVDVTISVAGNVSSSQMAPLREVPFKVVTFVQPGQIHVNLEKVPGWTTSSVGHFVRDYQMFLGFFAIAAAIGLFGWFMLQTVRETGRGVSRTLSEMAMKITERAADPHPIESAQPSAPSGVDPQDYEESCEGIQLFVSLAAQNPEQAAHHVQQWFRLKLRGSKQALKVVPSFLPQTVLLSVMQSLNMGFRRKWNKMMGGGIHHNDVLLADSFISGQIEPDQVSEWVDESLSTLLKTLAPEEATRCLEKDHKLGAVLVNFLPARKVAKIMALVDPEVAGKVLKLSLQPESHGLAAVAAPLKQLVHKVKNDHTGKAAHAVARTLPYLEDAGVRGEKIIFDQLAHSGEYQSLKDAAHKMFPAQLLWKLPPEILKEALISIDMDSMIQFAAGLPPKESETFNKCLDQLGDKVASYVRLEAQMIREDVKRRGDCEARYPALFEQLVESVRLYLSIHEPAQKTANAIVDEWVRSEGRKKKDAA